MGSAASVDPNVSLELADIKSHCGSSWNEILENRFNYAKQKHGDVTIADLKFLAPHLFTESVISLDEAKFIIGRYGLDWNEDINASYQSCLSNGVVILSVWSVASPTLFETPQDRERRLHTEFKELMAKRSEGVVTINYQMYNESFPISKNILTASRIDEDYGLSDVMPGCRIRLSTIDSKARTLYENAKEGKCEAPWVREDPIGTFQDLLSDEKYYCIVIEDPVQYALDQQAMREREGTVVEDEGGGRQEGCSCLYGNPCVDQYICKDWDNRYAVAKKNGWKGF